MFWSNKRQRREALLTGGYRAQPGPLPPPPRPIGAPPPAKPTRNGPRTIRQAATTDGAARVYAAAYAAAAAQLPPPRGTEHTNAFRAIAEGIASDAVREFVMLLDQAVPRED